VLAAAALAGAAGCGGTHSDVTGPAMALPRATVAAVSVDLRAGGGDASNARALARALGARSPLGFAGPVLRAAMPDAAGSAALFLLPARDGVGLNSGVVLETRDERAALDAARRIRPLVRAERAVRHGVVRTGTGLFRALNRLTDSPTAAAAAGRWVVWGDPRAVRAAVVAINGRSLGETVPFRRATEPFRDRTPALVYLEPRGLAGALVARAVDLPGSAGRALADRLLDVRFARPVAGRVRLARDHVTVDTGTQDGCPAVPLADAGGAPADAALVAGMPIYGLAQRQCRPLAVAPLRVGIPRTGHFDLDRALGWLAPSRLALRAGGLSIAARVRDPARAQRQLPRLRRVLDRIPGVRATLAGGVLDVTARGRPHLRLVVQSTRALVFVGPAPGPSPAQARTTAAYRQATRLLGDHRLTALAIRPRRGVSFVAVGAPKSGAENRGSGARVVIALR
jgi:hypothetical protein